MARRSSTSQRSRAREIQPDEMLGYVSGLFDVDPYTDIGASNELAQRQRQLSSSPITQHDVGGEGVMPYGTYENEKKKRVDLNPMQAASLATSFMPIVPDVLGVAGDLQMYNEHPEERSWGNYLMTGMGAFPFVPNLRSIKPTFGLPQNPVNKSKVGTLAATHNLSADNLRHADKMGGLPVPSIAITKGDSPIEGFGDITMVGKKELGKPSARNPIFRADAYSPRYPRAQKEFNPKRLGDFNESVMESANDLGKNYYSMGEGTDFFEVTDMRRDPVIMRHFLKSRGEAPEIIKYKGDAGSYSGDINPYATRGKMETYFAENPKMRDGFYQWTDETFESLDPKGKIFTGFTPSGNRRYKDENLPNVTKLMKGNINSGENMNYGIGSYRASITPRFKSLKQMKDQSGQLVDESTMTLAKDDYQRRYNDLLDDLAPYKTDEFSAGAEDFMVDIGLGKERVDDIFPNLPDDVMQKWREFDADLRDAPTRYFEGKPQRAVEFDEFGGAIVPDDTPDDVIEALKKQGIERIERYKDQKDRGKKLQLFNDLFVQRGRGLMQEQYT